MKTNVVAVAVAVALMGLLGHTAAASAQPCAARGAASPGALHQEWILVGWEKHADDPPFDFTRKLGRFYHPSAGNLVLYDDLSPGHRVARSAAEYGAMWTPVFSAQREVRHAVLERPAVELGAGVAVSTLEFAARLEAANGTVSGIRDRSTLTWRCTSGAWRIVREHNSSYAVAREEIDRLVPTAPKGPPAAATVGVSPASSSTASQ